MRQLEHPNIINLIDFSESKQYYYIILELAPGGELFHQIVRLTYFSEDLSRHVIVQVAKALEYLHEVRGVVHRSVTPFPSPSPSPFFACPVCLSVISCGLVTICLDLVSTRLSGVDVIDMPCQFQSVRHMTSYQRFKMDTPCAHLTQPCSASAGSSAPGTEPKADADHQ